MVNNEMVHIKTCIESLRKIPKGTPQWWNKFRFIRDRVESSAKIGKISIVEFLELKKVLEKLEMEVK